LFDEKHDWHDLSFWSKTGVKQLDCAIFSKASDFGCLARTLAGF
jgi:hypothetical protein